MLDRPLIIAEVVVGFPEAEMNVQASERVDFRPLNKVRHARDQGPVRLGHAFHRGKLLESAGMNIDDVRQLLCGLVENPAFSEQRSEENACGSETGLENDNTTKLYLCFVPPALHRQHFRQIVPALRRAFDTPAEPATNG